VAILPLFGVAILRSRLLSLRVGRAGDLPWAGWAVAVALAALVGARGLDGMELLAVLPGALFLASPMWLAHKGGLSRIGVLTRDLPALGAVAVLGWGFGLLVAVLWRLVLVVAMVPKLVERAPRAGTDVLFFTVVALPVAVEIGLRTTYLDEGWSPAHLSGAERGAGEDASGVVPYWSGSCGDDAAVVWWFGGSSAGGAYQLGGQPAAFFPGRVHGALCDQGVAVRTVNFSNGGRDSYTFSRALPELLAGSTPPDLVVVYVGVNDLLTENSSQTRKQREQARAETEQTTGVLARVAERSRLISGASLLARPVADQPNDFVPAVPVVDAEENLRTIISLVEQVGGRVLLVPELTRPSSPEPMAPYRTMQRRLAQDEASVEWFDVVVEMADQDPEGVFVDRNHLSMPGHEAVAIWVAPAVRAMLPADGPTPEKLP
jgi:lysophospholipase L1-like esterase